MGEFRRGQRVIFNRDYPVGDVVIPEGTKGIVLAAGRGISEVKVEGESLLVENEFLDFLEEGIPYAGEEYKVSLEELRAQGEELHGGSWVGRNIPKDSMVIPEGGEDMRRFFRESSN